ncbi:MAG: S41 family peptidase [Longimicrobiales bacterium]
MLRFGIRVSIWSALPLVLLVQSGAAQRTPLDARTRAAVIDSLAKRLELHYIDLDTARLIGNALRAQLRAGAYDTLTTAARFAEVVTRHLRTVNGDRHLSLQIPPTGGGSAGPALAPAAGARRQNFGLAQVEILQGNIGYLEIRGFQGQPGFETAVANALRVLENTDAVLIDVRRNGGGSGQMSHLVFSHFLPAEPVPTIRVYNRAANSTRNMQSVAEVTGPRRTDVPLYVLTSQGTASAAEEFSFVLKNLKRATLVGDRTAGAGHMVGSFPVGGGFAAGISITRVMDARTGLEWEGGGVQPDIRVPAENARDVAHAAALKRIAAASTDALLQRSLQLIAESIEARVTAPAIDATQLARWAGNYDEGRVVKWMDGRLWFYRRAEILPDELIPLGGNRFALNGAQRITFAPRGNGVVMTVEAPDGTQLSYAKINESRK